MGGSGLAWNMLSMVRFRRFELSVVTSVSLLTSALCLGPTSYVFGGSTVSCRVPTRLWALVALGSSAIRTLVFVSMLLRVVVFFRIVTFGIGWFDVD